LVRKGKFRFQKGGGKTYWGPLLFKKQNGGDKFGPACQPFAHTSNTHVLAMTG
jgi:hypothetical protein